MDPRHKFRHLKPLNVENMKNLCASFHEKSTEIETKMNKLLNAREELKTSQFLFSVREIWRLEMRKLRHDERDLQLDASCKQYLCEITDLNGWINQMESNESEFHSVYLKPFNTLRTDLKNWISLPEVDRGGSHSLDEIRNLIETTHQTEQKLIEELKMEENECCQQGDVYKPARSTPGVFTANVDEMGIPTEAWGWEAPNSEMLSDMLAEFIRLDVALFNQLEEVRSEFLNLQMACADVPEETFDQVSYFWDIFVRHSQSPNRRRLALQFLKLHFNALSAEQLERSLDVIIRQKQLKDRAQTIKRTWATARREMSTRIRSLLIEASDTLELRRLENRQKEIQQEICILLRKQVVQWRKQKLEMLELEAHEEAKQREKEESKKAAEASRKHAERQSIKEKVASYKQSKQKLHEEKLSLEAERLKKLREIQLKQSRIDSERLLQAEKQRLNLIQNKKRTEEQRLMRLKEQRERHLQAICETVRPIVNSDQARIMSYTKSWNIRLDALQKEKEAMLNHQENPTDFERIPHQLYTFTDEALCADRRTRLTAALHSAGVLDSDYARCLLAETKPNHPTRKGTETSELLKSLLNPDNYSQL